MIVIFLFFCYHFSQVWYKWLTLALIQEKKWLFQKIKRATNKLCLKSLSCAIRSNKIKWFKKANFGKMYRVPAKYGLQRIQNMVRKTGKLNMTAQFPITSYMLIFILCMCIYSDYIYIYIYIYIITCVYFHF